LQALPPCFAFIYEEYTALRRDAKSFPGRRWPPRIKLPRAPETGAVPAREFQYAGYSMTVFRRRLAQLVRARAIHGGAMFNKTREEASRHGPIEHRFRDAQPREAPARAVSPRSENTACRPRGAISLQAVQAVRNARAGC
jgi:hypothetical protein